MAPGADSGEVKHAASQVAPLTPAGCCIASQIISPPSKKGFAGIAKVKPILRLS
jgi:hypothetical protein